MSNKAKFKIVEKKDNPYDILIESTVIEKEWITTFTIADIEKGIKDLSKLKKEIEGIRMIESAKIQNIKINHPELDLNLDKKQQIAYTVNQQALALIKESDKKLKEINNQLEIYVEDLKEIFKQIGIKLPEPKEEPKPEPKTEPKPLVIVKKPEPKKRSWLSKLWKKN